MGQGILRTYDLNPDGIRIVVRWNKFVVGTSIFIPCIDTVKAVQQINKITSDKEMQVKSHVRVENDRLGVRVWRLL